MNSDGYLVSSRLTNNKISQWKWIHGFVISAGGACLLLNPSIGKYFVLSDIWSAFAALLFFPIMRGHFLKKFFVLLLFLSMYVILRFSLATTTNLEVTLILRPALLLIFGFVITQVLFIDAFCEKFSRGLVFGALGTTAIGVLQVFGYTETMRGVGILPDISVAVVQADGSVAQVIGNWSTSDGSQIRYAMMWQHPNTAGHIVSLSMAGFGYLFVRTKNYMWMVLGLLVLAAVAHVTQNRGGTLAGVMILMAAWSLRSGKRVGIVKNSVRIGLFVTLIVIFGGLATLVFPDRFNMDAQAFGNLNDRLASVYAGIGYCLSNPFGGSLELSKYAIFSRTGVSTIHNGFVSAAAVMGIVWGLLLFVATVSSLFADNLLIRLFAVHVLVAFQFEPLSGESPIAIELGLLISWHVMRKLNRFEQARCSDPQNLDRS